MRRVFCCLALAACGVEETPDVEDPWLGPNEVGPYDAGRVTLDLELAGEIVRADVWYPATIPAGTPPSEYRDVGDLTGISVEFAPAVKGGGPYPLVVFSHGMGGIRFQSVFLTEHLATHGFVVVAPDHPGSILLDVDTSPETILRRPTDVIGAVDEVLRLSAGDHELLGGMVDGDEYTLIGHSAGAITVQAVAGGTIDADFAVSYCEEGGGTGCRFIEGADPELMRARAVSDPRATLAVLLSPGAWYMFGDDGAGLANMVPTLVLTGIEDSVLEYDTEALPVYRAIGSEKWLGSLADVGHYSAFSDMCRILPVFRDCQEGFLDPLEGQRIVRTLVTSFLGSRVLGDPRYETALRVEGQSDMAALTWQEGG